MKDELEVLQSINHINIMRVIQILEDDMNYYVVSEFLRGGELFDRIIKNKSYNEATAAEIIEQVLSALVYMHETKNLMHRDLKPENILMESDDPDNFQIKVSDFGFATKIVPEG
jgi:calcium-dependent protein kinase